MTLFAPCVQHLSRDSQTCTSVVQDWKPSVVERTSPAQPELSCWGPCVGLTCCKYLFSATYKGEDLSHQTVAT